MRKLFSVITVIAMVSSLSMPVFANDATWNGTTDALWASATNWSDAVWPVAGNTATFNNVGGADDTINLGGAAAAGTILFDLVGCAAYTIGVVGVDTLTLSNGGGITVNNTVVQTQTIAANVLLSAAGANGTFTNNGANDAFLLNVTGNVTGNTVAGTLTLQGSDTGNNTVSGVIADGAAALAVTKAEAGTWILSGANTYTGATAINAGVLNIQNATATGTIAGGVTVANGAALQIQGTIAVGAEALSLTGTGIGATGALRNILNDNSWAGVITLAGATRINSDAGTLTLGAGGVTGAGQNLTVGGAGNTTVTGVIGTTTGTLTKDGAGTLTLSGANTYTGTTTIDAGTVKIGVDGALGTNAAGTTVTAGNVAALDLNGINYATTEALALNGTGVAGAGALLNSAAGAATYAGAITLQSASTITSTGAGGLTLTGGITNAGFATTFDGANATTVSTAKITGAGGVTKAGAGTLTLNFANDYTGATAVNAGVLNIQNASALGTVAAGTTVANLAALQIQGGITTLAEALTLNGLGIAGANGALRNIAGANDYAGLVTLGSATRIDSDAGTLTLSNAGTITGATFGLTVGGAGNTTVNSIIGTTTGTLTKDGAGTLTLSGANTYTGKTSIQAGTLSAASLGDVGGAASSLGIPGNVANGTIAFGSAATTGQLTYTGTGETTDRVIDLAGTTGGGTIDQSGTGALVFSSANTATGNGIKTLTLQGSTAGTGQISGAIVDSGAGATSVTKTGTGTWTLSGVNTYTGLTTITTGTLRARNAQAFGTGAVTNNATLSIDTTSLSITGVYTQNAASTLTLTANSAASYGNITSPAAAVVNAGSTVAVTVGGYMANGATLTIIDAAAGATVNVPTTITSSNSKYTFAGSVVNGDLILTANRGASGGGGFAGDATPGDSNASAIGTVLDNVTSPSTDMTAVLNTMDGLSASQVASALDSMVPEVDAGVINTSTTVMNNFVGVAMDRVEQTLKVAKAADSAASGISAGEASKLNGIWGKGYGSYLTQGTRNGIAGYDAWNAGTALGADHLFADCATVGISGGYAYGNVDSKVNNANTYINSAQTTVYGGYEDPNLPFFVDAAGSFAWNWYNGQRDINVGNVILRTANASYDGQQYGAYIGSGYRFDVTKNIEFTPLLSLQYNHLQLQSYTETEAGALNLSVASQGYDQLQSGLGARIAAPIKYKWGTFTPEAHGKWFYDFIGDPATFTSNFNGGGGDFNSNGAKPALNSFNAGGQLIFDFKNDISLIANCDTELKDQFFGIYGSATVRYEF
ncbi:MAG: autotransporter domain-containing protein [Candidatus Omnitrophica bacterium]|nr:autotransporter domain-containing protein [Candidatus Omnitrophota bacterium]